MIYEEICSVFVFIEVLKAEVTFKLVHRNFFNGT